MIDESFYNSPKQIREILEQKGWAAQKKYGQNFLIDENIRRQIVGRLGPVDNLCVWDIGSGLGAMTKLLLLEKARVVAFEIDKGYTQFLKENYPDPHLSIVEGDFLKTWKKAFDTSPPRKIIGNLPYNISSVIVVELIQENRLPEQSILMLQKEMAERMTAHPGTKNYSSFSLVCQFGAGIHKVNDVSHACFFPKPHVDSQILELIPHPEPLLQGKARDVFFGLTRGLFGSRRKTIKNNTMLHSFFRRWTPEERKLAFEESEIDWLRRPETLSLEEVLRLALRFSSLPETT